MKRLKILVLFSLIIGVLFMLCSCGKNQLATPQNVSVDIENQLTWNSVEHARGYVVEIEREGMEDQQLTPRKNTASLDNLAEGDYEVRIKALGDGKNFNDSDWTETLYFHKEYDTGCVYSLINNNTEYEITKFGKAPDTIYIEDVYRGKPVTKIAAKAFKGYSKIINVYVGNNVKTIGEGAFQNCKKLKKVVLPDTLQSIGASAFQGCMELMEINLPKSLTKIAENTFSYCRSLSDVTIHENITEIGMLAFSDCSNLTALTIPDTVTSVGEAAFTGNTSLTTIKLGSGLTVIEPQTFYMCSALKTIEFSQSGSLKTIGQNAFGECVALETVTIPNGVEVIDSWAFCMEGEEKKDAATGEIIITYNSLLSEVKIPETTYRVGQSAFFGTKFYVEAIANGDDYIFADEWLVACSTAKQLTLNKITNASLGNTVVGIADYVFYNCVNLTEVELPYTIKYIGEGAFAGNENLYKLNTSNLERIGDRAFYGCKILNKLTLGVKLKRIGVEAFYACERLDSTELTQIIPDSVESIGTDAFKGTALWKKPDNYGIVYAGNWVVGFNGSPASVVLKEGVKGVADYAFYNCATLTGVDGLDSVKYIGRGAFMNCERLADVTLGNNLTEILDYTFYGCKTMYSIELPRKLEKIGRSAFYECAQLKEIDINRTNVTEIDEYAFYGCTNLKTVDLGDKITIIGNYAFFKCESMTSIEIPNTVESIGQRAFYKCLALSSLSLGDNVEYIGDYAFAECAALKRVEIPASVKAVGNRAFSKCSELTYLTLNEGLESIGEYAFYNCSSLRTLALPDSVKTISKYAFKGCSSLSSLVLKESLEELGAHSFYGCKSMTVYTEAPEDLGKWNKYWNSMRRPIVYGCQLSEDKSYVVSLTVTENNFQNNRKSAFGAPERKGYRFVGWTMEEDWETKENVEIAYDAAQAYTAPVGTTLYAVWSDSLA